MKKLVLMTLVLAVTATMAFGQALPGGSIGVFADVAGVSCNIADSTAASLKQIFFVHTDTGLCLGGSQFAAPLPGCFVVLQDLGESYPAGFVPQGNSTTGIALGYGGQKNAPLLVVTRNLFLNGATPACCYWTIQPDPAAATGNIEVADCVFDLYFAAGGTGIINYGPSCNCNTPIETSTWGGMKAIYSTEY